MLTFIELSNFGIFKNKTFIDFKATKYESLKDSNIKNGYIKTALFYGPNGSGKTTILKAIAVLIEMLCANIPFNPAFISNFGEKGSAKLRYGFLIDGRNIEYSFTVNINSDIKEERLIIDKEEVFNRVGTGATTKLITSEENQEIDSKVLFLKALKFSYGFSNIPVLDKLYNFIKNSIVKKEGIPYTIVCKKVNILNQQRLFIFLKNNIINNEVELNQESYGNRILISYLVYILAVNKQGGMILFDEFGGGLHNKLNELVFRYLNKEMENVQSFISTHETNLLKTSLTRPDQIFLVDYEKHGAFIKRASDENPREAQNLEKMYLAGLFGGTPSYDKN